MWKYINYLFESELEKFWRGCEEMESQNNKIPYWMLIKMIVINTALLFSLTSFWNYYLKNAFIGIILLLNMSDMN